MSKNSDHVLIHYGCRLCTLYDEDAKQNGYTPLTRPKKNPKLCIISDFRRGANELFTFLVYFVVSFRRSGTDHPIHIKGSSISKNIRPLKMGPICSRNAGN